MVATITPSINLLLARLKKDYPAICFSSDTAFHWSPTKHTIFYVQASPGDMATLLHELAHAILNHKTHQTDIELIRQEQNAWEYAKSTLGPQYQIAVDNDIIESNLDTYRNWLHDRSVCPNCQAIGLQIDHQLYHCVACEHTWKVNEAKQCELRRYDLTKKK